MTLTKLGFDREPTKRRMHDLLAGAAAGVIGNFAVAPIDAIKDTMKMNQTANRNALTAIDAGKMPAASFHAAPIKMMEVAKDIWTREKGLKNKAMGFYRGSGTSALKIAPAAALQFMLYGLGKEILERKDKRS
jgi:hypothetical protein